MRLLAIIRHTGVRNTYIRRESINCSGWEVGLILMLNFSLENILKYSSTSYNDLAKHIQNQQIHTQHSTNSG